MSTTAFITHCWKKARLEALPALLAVCLLLLAPRVPWAQSVAEVGQLRLERAGDSLLLSASVRLDLPQVVEDALHKGVPIFFVAEAELLRERWYWADKKVAGATRYVRLAFHPLTRRWRLSGGAQAPNGEAAGALSRSFDTLEDALGAALRITGWRLGEVGPLEADARYRLEFSFKLDASQLPRPLQIGVLGQSDWNIAASASQKFAPGALR